MRAVLLIPLLILCQNQVKGLDYGCKCGVAKKGTLKGFRTQAATSGPVINYFISVSFYCLKTSVLSCLRRPKHDG